MPFHRGRFVPGELIVPGQTILPPRAIPEWARTSREDILEDQLAGIQNEMAVLHDTIDLDEGRELYEGSLIEFFRAAWNEIDKLPFKLNWHHECIAEHLIAVANGEIKKLLINIPPRTGKTSLCTVVFPAWLWAQSDQSFLCGPQASFLCVSYGETPAFKQANTARRLLMGKWYQRYWGDKVRITKDGLDELQNDRGGYRISSSLAGAILGSGANLRIVDDPHNTKQAESTIDRENTVQLFSEGLTTRRTDPLLSAIIVVMQRLHADDVSGYILENEPDYTQLILPMRYDPRRFVYSRWSNDPREEEGELLWADQFPAQIVDEDERTLAVYAFAGQYQQSPVPRGGGIIERNWFRLWPDDSPEMAERATVCSCACGWMGPVPGGEAVVSCVRCGGAAERKVVYPPFSYRVLCVDTNYGEKDENSWSAAVCLGVWHGKDDAPRAMLMTAWRGRPKLRTPPQLAGTRPRPDDKGLVERIHEIATRHQVDEILIEQKQRGFDLYNELELHTREWPYRLVYWNPSGRGDKTQRLNATVPIYTNDLVWAPNKGWAETTINEITTAPKSKFFDLTDCVTMGLLYLRHDRNMLSLPDEYRREQIHERILQSQSGKPNVSEMIEGV